MLNHRLLTLLSILMLAACGEVNQPIAIDDGAHITENQSTVNGTIQVGRDAEISANVNTVNGRIEIGANSQVQRASTVNGRIELGAGSSAQALETVNGRIEIGADGRVDNAASTVNGNITLAHGAQVAGVVSTVNGAISLDAAEAGSIRNTNGDITLDNGSVVHGELRVRPAQEERRFLWMRREQEPSRIVIGRDSRVVGPLVFEREVELFVHDSAEIGEVEGAEAMRYSGDAP